MKPLTRSEEWEIKSSMSYLTFCALTGLILVLDGLAFGLGDKIGYRVLGLSFIIYGGFFAGRWLYWEYLRYLEKVRT